MPRLRLYRLLPIAVGIALALALLSGRIAGWQVFLFGGVVAVGALSWLWFTYGRRQEPELGPVLFSDAVWVKVSPSPLEAVPSFYVRLLVGRETIATRALLLPRVTLPHVVGKVLGRDYTLRAADFEVDLGHAGLESRAIGAMTFSDAVGPGKGMWDRSVVLRGSYGSHLLELAFFRSTRATREEVEQELIRAGARPAEELVPTHDPG